MTTKTVGAYQLKQKIGSGSFATVYKGQNKRTGEEVAIKMISREKLNKKLQENLESEISILKSLQHENIVGLKDIQKTDRHYYLVLEYCAGGDLSKFVRKRGMLSEPLAQHFLYQLARGLQFLRAHNLIHRDLKPQNLLLSDEGDEAVLKIADFGFARYIQPQGLAETLCGSPLYMAPEILQYQKYDAKADLWSVGTIVFEMLTGRPPFTGNNHLQLLENIEKNELRLPQDVAISPDCLSLLQGLLRRNPVERLSFEEFFSHPYLAHAVQPTFAANDSLAADILALSMRELGVPMGTGRRRSSGPAGPVVDAVPVQEDQAVVGTVAATPSRRLSADPAEPVTEPATAVGPWAVSSRRQSAVLSGKPTLSPPFVPSPAGPSTHPYGAENSAAVAGALTSSLHSPTPKTKPFKDDSNVPSPTQGAPTLPSPHNSRPTDRFAAPSATPGPEDFAAPLTQPRLPTDLVEPVRMEARNLSRALGPSDEEVEGPENSHEYVLVTANVPDEAAEPTKGTASLLFMERMGRRACAVALFADHMAGEGYLARALLLCMAALELFHKTFAVSCPPLEQLAPSVASKLCSLRVSMKAEFNRYLKKAENLRAHLHGATADKSLEQLLYEHAIELARDAALDEWWGESTRAHSRCEQAVLLLEALLLQEGLGEADKLLVQDHLATIAQRLQTTHDARG